MTTVDAIVATIPIDALHGNVELLRHMNIEFVVGWPTITFHAGSAVSRRGGIFTYRTLRCTSVSDTNSSCRRAYNDFM